MDLSIIIVNYNSLKFLKKCLDSINLTLLKIDGKRSISHEIVVVDNGSGDGSIEFLKKLKAIRDDDSLKFIDCGKNTGFSAASNKGAGLATGRYLLFLNPDTELTYGVSHFIEVIDFYREKSNKEKIGALGVKTINPDGSIQFSCRSFPTLARQFYESFSLHKIFKRSRVFGAYFMTYSDHDKDMEVDWLSGSFIMIEKSIFDKIGCFDEDYFIYSEDTDLCLRLKRKGFKNYYYSRYKIIHSDAGIASKNMPLRESQIGKSRKKYFLKNYSRSHAAFFGFLYFKYLFNRIIVFSILAVFKNRRRSYKTRLKNYSSALKLYLS